MDSHEALEFMFSSMQKAETETEKKCLGSAFIQDHSAADVIDALSAWLQSRASESVEQYHESVGRRLLWVFANGLTLTIGSEINLTLASLDKKITEESELPPVLEQKHWEYLPHANGWSINRWCNKFQLLEIVQALETLYGQAKAVLPWEKRAESAAEQEQDEFVFPNPTDDSEGYNSYLDLYRLLILVSTKEIKYFSAWEIEITHEDSYLSMFSDLGKYRTFIGHLRESKLAILNLEEHCYSCSLGFAERAVEEDPELEGRPTFTTWSQNSNRIVRPDGAIKIEAHCRKADFETKQSIRRLAEETGLACELGPDSILFQSTHWEY